MTSHLGSVTTRPQLSPQHALPTVTVTAKAKPTRANWPCCLTPPVSDDVDAPQVVHVDTAGNRARLTQLLATYGSGPHAIALAPKFRLFSVPSIDGAVPFIRRAKCTVVFGDPLCAPADKKALAQAFHAYCHKRSWPVVYIGGSEAFAKEASDTLQCGRIQFGMEHVLNPETSPLRNEVPSTPAVPSKKRAAQADPALAETIRVTKLAHKKAEAAEQKRAAAECKRRKEATGAALPPEVAKEVFKDLQQLRDAHRLVIAELERQIPAPTPQPPSEAERELRRNAANVNHEALTASRKGVEIREYDGRMRDDAKERQMHAVAERWLAARSGPQVFAGVIEPFAARDTGRWFVAECDMPGVVPDDGGEPVVERRVVGLLTLTRLATVRDGDGAPKTGWLIDHLVTDGEPRGISQLLVKTAIETLGAEGKCNRLSWGVAARPELGESSGLSKFAAGVARQVHGRSNNCFHFERKINFRKRFLPESEEALNLVFYPARVGVLQVLGIMKAMNVRFSLKTLGRMAFPALGD